MKMRGKITYLSSVCMFLLSTGCTAVKKDAILPVSELKECTYQDTYRSFTSLGTQIHKEQLLQCKVENETENETEYYYIKDIDALAEFYRVYGVHGSRTDQLWFGQHMDIDDVVDCLNEIIPARFSVALTSENGKTELTLEMKDARYEHSLQVAEQVAHEIKNSTSDPYTQMVYAHNYIVNHTVYQRKGDKVDEASGVFLDGFANCSGYARAYMMLLQQLEIPVMYISSKEMNHAWNFVYDGNTYYYVDTTMDDSPYIEPYYYIESDYDLFLSDHPLDSNKGTSTYMKRMGALYQIPSNQR